MSLFLQVETGMVRSSMKAMILSAGRGERMRPLTDESPKALLPVSGRPLIEYHLAALRAARITDVVINLAWLGDKLRAALGDGDRFGLRIEYSNEGAAALDTGGGIFRALPMLGPEPFWVINSDVLTDYQFTDADLDAKYLGRLVLVSNPAHNPDGDFGLQGSQATNVAEHLYTYSGIGLFRPELFAGQQEGVWPLTPLLRDAAERGKLAAELHGGAWIDVGTPERLAQAERSIRG